MITLITCSDFNTSKYGYGQHRTVVQGDLISKIKATNKNLSATELTANFSAKRGQKKVALPTKKGRHTIKKNQKIRAKAQPKFFQNMTLIKAAIIIFNVIFFLIIVWRLVQIWRS